jgi:hypothetical protein
VGGWSLPPTIAVGDLGAFGTPVSEDAGEAKAIYPLTKHPEYLFKWYKKPMSDPAAGNLNDLIYLPLAASDADRAIIGGSTSWPVAAVTDQGRTVGCVIPLAPEKFRAEFRSPGTPPAKKLLEIDFLAKEPDALVRRGLPPIDLEGRIAVCRHIVAVADLLARHGLVYSDWSYSNAFWSITDRAVFVIDIDGCTPLQKSNVYQPNWDDPYTRREMPADASTDRYRVALLVARCVTGERERDRALHALLGFNRPALAEVLLDSLLSTDRNARPPLATVATVLGGNPYVRFPVPRADMPPKPAPIIRKVPAAAQPRPIPTATTPVSGPTPTRGVTPLPGIPDRPQFRTAAYIAAVVVLITIISIIIAIVNH